MRKNSQRALVLVSLLAVLFLPALALAAQETPEEAPGKPGAAYRVDFVVRELQKGKVLNSRSYKMLVADGQWGRFRTGGAVTVHVSGSNPSFQVGLKLDCRVHSEGDLLALDVQSEITDFVVPPTETADAPRWPIQRTASAGVNALVKLDKPAVIAVLDDTVTDRSYELEVTARKAEY